MRLRLLSTHLVGIVGVSASVFIAAPSQPLSETELFLREAKVMAMDSIPVGITRPQKLTLVMADRTGHAVWKTIHRYEPGLTHLPQGSLEMGFRDSYKHEIAAYELDKMLGLGVVPVTVERTIKGRSGSVQLWVENAMSEFKRLETGNEPPDPVAFNDDMYRIRLLHQLVSNEDYDNANNVLIDSDFKPWAIDHSRAFQIRRDLRQEKDLLRFSRSAVERMAKLSLPLLEEKLGDWLTDEQLRSMLERRDRIIDRVGSLIATKGESAVLY